MKDDTPLSPSPAPAGAAEKNEEHDTDKAPEEGPTTGGTSHAGLIAGDTQTAHTATAKRKARSSDSEDSGWKRPREVSTASVYADLGSSQAHSLETQEAEQIPSECWATRKPDTLCTGLRYVPRYAQRSHITDIWSSRATLTYQTVMRTAQGTPASSRCWLDRTWYFVISQTLWGS